MPLSAAASSAAVLAICEATTGTVLGDSLGLGNSSSNSSLFHFSIGLFCANWSISEN